MTKQDVHLIKKKYHQLWHFQVQQIEGKKLNFSLMFLTFVYFLLLWSLFFSFVGWSIVIVFPALSFFFCSIQYVKVVECASDWTGIASLLKSNISLYINVRICTRRLPALKVSWWAQWSGKTNLYKKKKKSQVW